MSLESLGEAVYELDRDAVKRIALEKPLVLQFCFLMFSFKKEAETLRVC